MSAFKFKGTGVALITPFKKNGDLDMTAFEQVLSHVEACDYYVLAGTTGETSTLSKEEKNELLSALVSFNKGKKPIVFGIGGNDTREVLKTIEKTSFEHISAILSVAPYYSKPTQSGILAHYEAIAKFSPAPIIMYNVPGRTGVNMSMETTLKLADNENIIATKEASGNMHYFLKLIKDAPEDFLVISGDDALTLPGIMMGASGVISVIANVFPQEFSDMVRFALKGNYKNALNLHNNLFDFIDLLFKDGSPAGAKAAMHLMRLCENELRLPLVPVGEKVMDEIKAYLKKMK